MTSLDPTYLRTLARHWRVHADRIQKEINEMRRQATQLEQQARAIEQEQEQLPLDSI